MKWPTEGGALAFLAKYDNPLSLLGWTFYEGFDCTIMGSLPAQGFRVILFASWMCSKNVTPVNLQTYAN
jgi:hypothetical protein